MSEATKHEVDFGDNIHGMFITVVIALFVFASCQKSADRKLVREQMEHARGGK